MEKPRIVSLQNEQGLPWPVYSPHDLQGKPRRWDYNPRITISTHSPLFLLLYIWGNDIAWYFTMFEKKSEEKFETYLFN